MRWIPILLLLILSCKPVKKQAVEFAPATKDELLTEPLYIPLEKEQFTSRYEKFKTKTFIRTPQSNQSRTDTIYRYYRKNTAFIFYKVQNEDTYFLTANVKDDLMPLKGGIRIGMNKEKVADCITDYDRSNMQSDTVKLTSENNNQLIFIFKKEALKEVQINSYYRQ